MSLRLLVVLLTLGVYGAGAAADGGKVAATQPAAAAGAKLETVTDTLAIEAGGFGYQDVAAKFEFVRIPAGRVTLKGADGKETVHEVKAIWVAKHEVTWDLYFPYWTILDLPEEGRQRLRQVDAKSRPSVPYENPDRGWGFNDFPAGSVHPNELARYVAWLSKMTGKKYRLPTEAEWEYACRAGAGGPVKLDEKALAGVAWFAGNSPEQPRKVGTKRANAWGLHDMLGNVAEWVVRADGELVAAGGSYQDEAADVHSGARLPIDLKRWQMRDCQEPKSRSWLTDGMMLGIRLVREE